MHKPTKNSQNKPPRVSAIILDMGNVLIELDFPALYRNLGMLGLTSEEQAIKKMESWPLNDAFERGDLTAAEFCEELEHFLRKPITIDFFNKAWNTVFVGPVVDIEPFIQTLASKVPLYVLTNTNITHMKFCLSAFPFLNTVRQIFTSYELHARKPEKEIFETVLQSLQLQPEEVLYVDDRQINLEAAHSLGIHTEHCFNSTQQLKEIVKKYLPTLDL